MPRASGPTLLRLRSATSGLGPKRELSKFWTGAADTVREFDSLERRGDRKRREFRRLMGGVRRTPLGTPVALIFRNSQVTGVRSYADPIRKSRPARLYLSGWPAGPGRLRLECHAAGPGI